MKDCAFCPQPADSREHFWSEWIGELFGPRKYTITRRDQDGSFHTIETDKLDLKAWTVCHKCNSGWMSDLEGQTKSIVKDTLLRGERLVLGKNDAKTLAAFVLVKAVVADMIAVDRTPIFSVGERRIFGRTREVPSGVQVWLASLPGQNEGVFKNVYIETQGSTARDFQTQIFTLGAGYLVFQCAISRWRRRTANYERDEIGLTQNPVWQEVSLASWPWEKTVCWPPEKPLSGIVLDQFIARWSRLAMGPPVARRRN